MFWLYALIWVIGAITAYPKNRKWLIEEGITRSGRRWTSGDALNSIFTCTLFWYIVWIWYLCILWDRYYSKWWNKDSKT